MVLITFIRHAESCSNIIELNRDFKTFNYDEFIKYPSTIREVVGAKISHPPLTYNGIQQAIILGVHYFNTLPDLYDVYYCSPSIRTIMTALLSLRSINYYRKKNNKSPIILQLIPEIIERKSIADTYDLQNSVISSDKLKLLVEYVKWWFVNKWFTMFIDYEFFQFIEKLKDIIINFYQIIDKYCDQYKVEREIITNISKILEILEKCNNSEKKKVVLDLIKLIKVLSNSTDETLLQIIDQINNLDFYKFLDPDFYSSCDINFDFILNTCVPDINLFIQQQESTMYKKVLCFSHGAVLKKQFKLTEYVRNTELIIYNSLYKSVERYNKHLHFKPYNETSCNTICGKLYDTSSNYMFRVINHLLSINNTTSELPVTDLFYCSHQKFKLKSIESNSNLKHKYLKYKKKYLHLTDSC